MATGPTHAHPHHFVLRNLARSVERTLGIDARLLYGMGVPMLMIVGLIALLALSPADWVVAVIVLCELAALGLVVAGLTDMMSDDQDEGP